MQIIRYTSQFHICNTYINKILPMKYLLFGFCVSLVSALFPLFAISSSLPKIISEIQILWDQLLKMRIGWSRYYVDVSVAHHWTKWSYSYSCPNKFIFKYKNVDWSGGTCTGSTVCVGEHFFLRWWAYLLSICHRKSSSPIVAGVLGHPDVIGSIGAQQCSDLFVC